MAFYERRSSRKIIRHWRVRRARIKKAEADAARRARKEKADKAREQAREQAQLHVSVDDDDDVESDAAPVSPIITQGDDEEDEADLSDEQGQASPSDARVGANLT